MLLFNDIEEDRAKRSTRHTLARRRRFPHRSHRAGIMRSALLALGIVTVSVPAPPVAAKAEEVDITCDESPIQFQMQFKTIADDDRYCRKWILVGKDGAYGELFHRSARFAGGSVVIHYIKAGSADEFIQPSSVKKWLESSFKAMGMSASNWGPTIKVKSGGKTFRTRKFVLSGVQTCVAFQATGVRVETGHADLLRGYFCETGQEYPKEFITAFLSQIKITRPSIAKPKRTSPDAYRVAIFPFVGKIVSSTFTGGQMVDVQAADIVQVRIQRESALALAYSHYDDRYNEPPIENPKRLWVGGANQKKPNLDVLYTIGRERGLDGIVMVRGDGGGLPYYALGTERMPITLYLIDVDRRQVYRRKGTVGTVRKMSKRVFAEFIKERAE